MSRLTVAVDRVVTLLVAVLLIVVGAACAVWGTDRVPPLDGSLDLGAVSTATTKTWWPWAVGVGGVIAVLLGLRWLFAHVPSRRRGPLRLSGTDSRGRLHADGDSAVGAAADELAATAGVTSTSGTLISDRGQLVARLRATIDPDADLATLADAADRTSARLQHVLGRDDLRCRVDLRLARREQARRRV